MAQISLYSMEGTSLGTLEVSDAVFAAPVRRDLLHQAVVRHLANQRAGTADTKGRGEVSGGGRKPWRQKGTGRSRHGSTRSPIWRKGGVVFGPHPRSYIQAMPRKMRRLALCSAISRKAAARSVIALDSLSFNEFKTKNFVKVLENLQITDQVLLAEKNSQQMIGTRHKTRVATHKVLVVIAERDAMVEGSAANLPNVKVITPNQVNVYDVLKYRRIVVTKDAIKSLEETLS